MYKINTCKGHYAAIYTVAGAFSEGKFFSAGGDRCIVEWDIHHPENGKLVATTETQIYALATLPGTPNRLVAGNMHGGLHWIDLAVPDLTKNIQHHQKGVFDLLVVGEWVFSAGGEGILTRWEAATARSVESYQLTNRSLRALAFSADRGELAVGASDGCVYLLDVTTMALRHTIRGAHTPSVFTVAYHPDGKTLLTGGRDALVKIWNLPPLHPSTLHSSILNAPPFLEISAHWFTINHLVFSQNGHFFATASRDKTVKVWDAKTFELLKVADTIRDGGHINSVNRLLWLDETLVSASDDRTIILWGFNK